MSFGTATLEELRLRSTSHNSIRHLKSAIAAATAATMSSALPYFVSDEGEAELPWSQSGIPSRRRAAPDGLVLFDRLLQLAQIDRKQVGFGRWVC